MRWRKTLVFALVLLLGAGVLAVAQSKPFVGNKNSKKYHVVECTYAQKMSPKNRVYFGSPEEAESAGYVPCKICKPQTRKKH